MAQLPKKLFAACRTAWSLPRAQQPVIGLCPERGQESRIRNFLFLLSFLRALFVKIAGNYCFSSSCLSVRRHGKNSAFQRTDFRGIWYWSFFFFFFPKIFKIKFEFNLLKTKRNLLCIRNQSVPRSKHFPTLIKTNQLMMYKAEVAVCSDIRTKHSTQSERHVEFLNVNLQEPCVLYIGRA